MTNKSETLAVKKASLACSSSRAPLSESFWFGTEAKVDLMSAILWLYCIWIQNQIMLSFGNRVPNLILILTLNTNQSSNPEMAQGSTKKTSLSENVLIQRVLTKNRTMGTHKPTYTHTQPYLVHIITAETISGVSIRARSTLDTVRCLSTHVVTETDTRGALWFHHLSSTQSFNQRGSRRIKLSK